MLADTPQWVTDAGVWAAAALGLTSVLVGLVKILRRVDAILETRQDVTTAMHTADRVEQAVQALKEQVQLLSDETTETFRTRTQDFTRLAHEASTRLRDLEQENARLKAAVAREAGRMDAHAIDDDRKFDRIERALADIRNDLARLSGAQTGNGDQTSTTPAV